jgi:hypothetical protein
MSAPWRQATSSDLIRVAHGSLGSKKIGRREVTLFIDARPMERVLLSRFIKANLSNPKHLGIISDLGLTREEFEKML